jgi:hypothetical protein
MLVLAFAFAGCAGTAGQVVVLFDGEYITHDETESSLWTAASSTVSSEVIPTNKTKTKIAAKRKKDRQRKPHRSLREH